MSMQDDIRFLAKQHGKPDLSDAEVKAIQLKIAASLVDDILDSTVKAPQQNPENGHGNGKTKRV